MKLPIWLIALLGLLWSAYSFNKVYCGWCGCCGTPAAVVPAISAPSGPLTFLWDKMEATTGTGFDAYKAGILGKGGLADTLVITGTYRADEKNTSSFENLGLARAHAAKALFIDKVPEGRIRLASALVTDDMDKTNPHESATFDWLVGKIDEKATTIIQSGNASTILFPFGSSSREKNKVVDDFLAELCAKYKSDANAKFSIVGHTDNVGNPDKNKQLGMNRAMAIRQVLRDCGIDRERIAIDSKGQEEPIASNDTDGGRHQNRRVVITVTQ